MLAWAPDGAGRGAVVLSRVREARPAALTDAPAPRVHAHQQVSQGINGQAIGCACDLERFEHRQVGSVQPLDDGVEPAARGGMSRTSWHRGKGSARLVGAAQQEGLPVLRCCTAWCTCQRATPIGLCGAAAHPSSPAVQGHARNRPAQQQAAFRKPANQPASPTPGSRATSTQRVGHKDVARGGAHSDGLQGRGRV